MTTTAVQERTRGQKVLVVFYILFIQMFTLFATDMYSPALPILTDYFSTSESLVNLTLMVFFAFMLVGIIIFGPVSDKFGRKPVLYAGSGLYVISSLACALSPTIGVLIASRIFQAIASGMVSVVGTALVKDNFEGKARENVLLWSQVAFILGPIAAPVVGGLTLAFFTWHATFYILAILGAIGFLLTFTYKDALPPDKRTTGSVLKSFSGLTAVLKSREFVIFMVLTTVFCALPFTAYLIAAPYVYENQFGFSPQGYSYFFGATAALSVLGILFYKVISPRITKRRLTTALIIATGIAGFGMVFFAHLSAYIFFGCILLLYITSTMIRPYSMNILLEMRSRDIGSASSVMNCSYTLMGVLGALFVVIVGSHYILMVGILILIGVLVSALLWIYFLHSKLIVRGIKDE